MEQEDLLFDMDACISDMTEWEMWDVVRSVYAPDSIPKEVQLHCFRTFHYLQSKRQPLIFQSFQFHGLISEFVQKHSHWMGSEFIFHEHTDRPHTQLVSLMLQKNPFELITDFNQTSILYANYDHKGERFVVLGGDIGYIRGLREDIQEKMVAQLPFLFMEAVSMYIASEHVRRQLQSPSPTQHIRPQLNIRIPPASTPTTPETPSSWSSLPAPVPKSSTKPQDTTTPPPSVFYDREPSAFGKCICSSLLPMCINTIIRYIM